MCIQACARARAFTLLTSFSSPLMLPTASLGQDLNHFAYRPARFYHACMFIPGPCSLACACACRMWTSLTTVMRTSTRRLSVPLASTRQRSRPTWSVVLLCLIKTTTRAWTNANGYVGFQTVRLDMPVLVQRMSVQADACVFRWARWAMHEMQATLSRECRKCVGAKAAPIQPPQISSAPMLERWFIICTPSMTQGLCI